MCRPELLPQAILHTDTDTPTVTVGADERTAQVRIRVADHGPDERTEVIFGRSENRLAPIGIG